MKAKWLIEDFNRDEHVKLLIEAIKRHDMEHQLIEEPFESGSKCYPNSSKECVIFYGSLNLGRQLRREKRWIPGVYCDLEQFKCTTYYAYWGKFLFNQDYAFIPVKELGRRKDWIYKQFGKNDRVFIRPNTGFKTFTGAVVKQENFDKDYEWMVKYSDDTSLAVISTPKNIIRESRFVVADKKVITGCFYKWDGSKLSNENIPEPNKEWKYAQQIADECWEPERMYVIDICEDKGHYHPLRRYIPENICGKFHLLEVNSFSCSGLYACDSDVIVKEASRIAIEEWKEINET